MHGRRRPRRTQQLLFVTVVACGSRASTALIRLDRSERLVRRLGSDVVIALQLVMPSLRSPSVRRSSKARLRDAAYKACIPCPVSMQLIRTRLSLRLLVLSRYHTKTLPTRHCAMSTLYLNKAVPGIDQYIPLNEPPIGTAYPEASRGHCRAPSSQERKLITCVCTQSVYPQNANLPVLFKPITIRGLTFKNRIFVVCRPRCDKRNSPHTSSSSRRCASTVQTTDTQQIGTSCTSAWVCLSSLNVAGT